MIVRARLTKLEQDAVQAKASKHLFSDNDWKDWVKLAGLPFVFIIACYSFYDDVFQRFRG